MTKVDPRKLRLWAGEDEMSKKAREKFMRRQKRIAAKWREKGEGR